MGKIILIIAVTLTTTFASAQLREKGTIELIPQIGYSSANYRGDNTSGNSPIGAAAFGVGGDYFFSNRWSLRSGLLFQTMGTEFPGVKEKLNYVTVPLNANWHFGSTRKWNLNFGPGIGFLTSAESNGQDVKDMANTTQISLNVGIGYKLEVTPKISILIDYQELFGLSDITRSSDNSIRNSYRAFDLGVVFKI